MKKYIIIIALTMGLHAQIPNEYKSLSYVAYDYIDQKQHSSAMDLFENMLIVSISRNDTDMHYRINNTMSSLALISNQRELQSRAYQHMQTTPFEKRDAKYYWLVTKLSQKLTNTIFPANLYHIAMCRKAVENNETTYLKKCENQYYFLNNFFQNIEKKEQK